MQKFISFFKFASSDFLSRILVCITPILVYGAYYISFKAYYIQLENDPIDISFIIIFSLVLLLPLFVTNIILGITSIIVFLLTIVFFEWSGFLVLFLLEIPSLFWIGQYKAWKQYKTLNKLD